MDYYQNIEENGPKKSWDGYGVEAMNAQLTYNNANLVSGICTEEKFNEWIFRLRDATEEGTE